MIIKNKLISFLIILLAVLVVGAFFSFFARENKLILTRSIEVVFNITQDEVGFNLNESPLDFGRIPLGSSSQREIILDNLYSSPVLVKISSSQEITGFFREPNPVYLEKGEKINVSLIVQVPVYSNIEFKKGLIFIQIFRI